MLRKLSFLAALMALLVGATAANADVFYSGTFNANGSVGGGNNVANASSLNLGAGGVSYNNVYGTGPGGSSVVGNTIVAVGFVPLIGANVNTNSNQSFGLANNNLVAVYAFQGTVTSPPINAGASFQIENPNNKGVIIIMDRSAVAGGGLDITNPSTWVNNLSDLTQGRVATLAINNLPTDSPYYARGLQGGPTVELPPVSNPANINTANTQFNASVQSAPEFKLQIVDGGTFLTNPQVFSPDGSIRLDYAMYLLLNQQLPLDQTDVPADVAKLNLIAMQLLGTNFATGIGTNGSDYNNIIASGSGDIALNNTGGRAIFGGQFAPATTEVPEPASLLVWSVIAAGAGVGMVRRRRQSA
jgi:hypothetical protein